MVAVGVMMVDMPRRSLPVETHPQAAACIHCGILPPSPPKILCIIELPTTSHCLHLHKQTTNGRRAFRLGARASPSLAPMHSADARLSGSRLQLLSPTVRTSASP